MTSIKEYASLIPGLIQWVVDLALPQAAAQIKKQLTSGLAVVVTQASSCSLYSTPSLGTSICHGCSPKNKATNKTKQKDKWQKKGQMYFQVGLLLDSSPTQVNRYLLSALLCVTWDFQHWRYLNRTQSLPSKGLTAWWEVSIHQVGQRQLLHNVMSSGQSAVGGQRQYLLSLSKKSR